MGKELRLQMLPQGPCQRRWNCRVCCWNQKNPESRHPLL